MININKSNIIGVSKGDTPFSKIYKGIDLIWRNKPNLTDIIKPKENSVKGDVVLWDKENQEKIFVDINNLKYFNKDNYTPIGVVAIEPNENKYGDGSGSMISLKIMDCNNPDNGWGYNDKSVCEQPYWGSSYTELGTIENDSNKAREFFNQDLINSKFRNYNPYNWKTSETINNVTTNNNYPAGFCCWRYHTDGTNQGDWYLPSSGEVSNTYIANISEIYLKLNKLGYNVYLSDNNPNNPNSNYSSNTCTEIRYDQQWMGFLYMESLTISNHSTKCKTFAFCKI